jgi:hypothetical protein
VGVSLLVFFAKSNQVSPDKSRPSNPVRSQDRRNMSKIVKGS